MKISELRALCSEISPLDGRPVEHIYLTLPLKRLPRGRHVNMLGRRGGPKGHICNVSETAQGYSCVANFKTSEILSLIGNYADE